MCFFAMFDVNQNGLDIKTSMLNFLQRYVNLYGCVCKSKMIVENKNKRLYHKREARELTAVQKSDSNFCSDLLVVHEPHDLARSTLAVLSC